MHEHDIANVVYSKIRIDIWGCFAECKQFCKNVDTSIVFSFQSKRFLFLFHCKIIDTHFGPMHSCANGHFGGKIHQTSFFQNSLLSRDDCFLVKFVLLIMLLLNHMSFAAFGTSSFLEWFQ